MSNLSSTQLRQAADIKDQIEALESELTTILGGSGGGSDFPIPFKAPKTAKKKGIGAAGRARIAAAQKARWAKFKAEKAGAKAAKPAEVAKPVKIKRKFSAAHLAKIRAAAKKRWAKAKAAGKNSL